MRTFISIVLFISANALPCSLIDPPYELAIARNWDKAVIENKGIPTRLWKQATLLDNIVHNDRHYAIFDLQKPTKTAGVMRTRNIFVVCNEESKEWTPVALPSTYNVRGQDAFINPPKFSYLSKIPSDQEGKLVVGGNFWGIHILQNMEDWQDIDPETKNRKDLEYFFTLDTDAKFTAIDGLNKKMLTAERVYSGVEAFTLHEQLYLSFLTYVTDREYKHLKIFSFDPSSGKWSEVEPLGQMGEPMKNLNVMSHLLITNNGERITFRGDFYVHFENNRRNAATVPQTWHFFGDRWVKASH